MPRRHKGQRTAKKGDLLGELLYRHPRLISVLRKHGVHFCSGCYLTLFSPPEKAAAYHAVTDLKAFLRDLRKAV